MEWCVKLTLRPGQAVLEQTTTLFNPSPARHRFYWWTDQGVQVWDDSRLYYPQGFSVFHGFTDLDTWPVDRSGVDLSVVGNHKHGAVSRFSSRAMNRTWRFIVRRPMLSGALCFAQRSAIEESFFVGQ